MCSEIFLDLVAQRVRRLSLIVIVPVLGERLDSNTIQLDAEQPLKCTELAVLQVLFVLCPITNANTAVLSYLSAELTPAK